MKLLDRYILREYLKPALFCLAGFCMVFVMWDLLGHIARYLNMGVSAYDITLYYLFTLASSLVLIAPASLLLATLYTLWQLMRSNQIVAMRACGISLLRIMMPLLAAGVVFSIFVAFLNDVALSRWSSWSERLRTRRTGTEEIRQETSVVQDVAFFNKAARRQWIVAKLDRNTPHLLHDIKITQDRPEKSKAWQPKMWELTAQRAEWLDGQWWLFDAALLRYTEQGSPLGKKAEPIPNSTLGIPCPEFTETPDDFLRESKPWEQFSALEMWRFLKEYKGVSTQGRAEKRYDLHSRFAMPWACLVVTLFGVPMGARTSRQGIVVGIFMAIGLLLLFYFLSQIGLYLGKQKHITPWLGAWLSNLVFFIVGAVMSFKMR